MYDESKWAPFTWDDALRPENAYTASKVSSFVLTHILDHRKITRWTEIHGKGSMGIYSDRETSL